MSKRTYIKWESERAKASLLGSKSYKLGELRRIGIKIPQGFTLTTKAFMDFISYNKIHKEIEELIAKIPSDTQAIENRSRSLQNLFVKTRIPDKILDELTVAYHSFTSSFKGKICLAVRSSSMTEDLKSASFAGLYDTFLRVESFDEMLKSIKECWQSTFGSRALTYFKKLNLKVKAPEEIAMGVIVQEMVNHRYAGVLITLNPVSGDSSKIFIEYSDKSGECVVSGECTPNSLLVDKISNRIDKSTVLKENGNMLEERYIYYLVDLAKKIERKFDSYQDIEWVIEKDASFPEDIIILQARPETIWNEKHLIPSREAEQSVFNFIPKVKIKK
ncbi:MAG: PEP/pyruvate-binding domain-containing protein [Sedimentisphaerales bacterium]|nr:PEP/pyruvate-binding domain-containing protein [Sedimentisphaerales bacterium]